MRYAHSNELEEGQMNLICFLEDGRYCLSWPRSWIRKIREKFLINGRRLDPN